MHYINSWCRIRAGRIERNGERLFESPESETGVFLTAAYRHLDLAYPKFHKMDLLCRLGFLAAELVLGAGFDKNAYPPEEVGLVLANAHSSLDTDVRYQQTLSGIPSPALFVYTLPNIVLGEICIRHQFKGEQAFFIFEKYEIPFLNDYTEQLLEGNNTRAILSGWIDVFDGHYEAFLYLVEKTGRPGALIHNQQTIRELYGSVDARP